MTVHTAVHAARDKDRNIGIEEVPGYSPEYSSSVLRKSKEVYSNARING